MAELRRDRSRRLTAVALGGIALAFVLAVVATLPMLALAPLLVGVPHVASDLRYLLEPLPRRGALPVAALFVVCVAVTVSGHPEAGLLAGCAAVLAAGLSSHAAVRARAAFAMILVAVAAIGAAYPHAARVTFAQGHNLIAVGLALWLARGRLRAGGWIAAAIAAGVLLLASGACDRWLGAPSGPFADAWRSTLASASPGGLDAVLARRCVAIFAFVQAVHYSAWLRWVPDAMRASERPPSYRRSFALLAGDLGRPAAMAVVAVSVALPLAACFSLDGAREAYFDFAAFHGFVEVAFIVCLILPARRA